MVCVTAIFLSFFVFTQLSVMLCFVVGSTVSPFVAPLALLLSLATGDWLARREGLRGRLRIVPSAIVLTVVALALYLASAFFDMSWDGLWYHQTAVYQMSHGWNPLRDPMHSLAPHLQDWLHHYAKGPWYVALALFQTTHHIEWAKAAPWMALAATFLAVFAAGLDFGMRRRTAIVIAALVSLNPVVTCQLVSYLVDGLMVSFMACFVAALFRWFRRPSLLIHWILMASAILCINAKLTGLVYLCFGCAAGGLYVLMKRRDLLIRYAAFQLACILLGAVVFGFNPFVTNTVHRGNPFYPWLGSAAHPSFAQRGQDPNELYETPNNMKGRSRFVRLGYAIFSHPGPQTFYNGEPAQLMWPFNVRWNDFTVFRFHEVRISGFGPLFSGAFLISLCSAGHRPGPTGHPTRDCGPARRHDRRVAPGQRPYVVGAIWTATLVAAHYRGDCRTRRAGLARGALDRLGPGRAPVDQCGSCGCRPFPLGNRSHAHDLRADGPAAAEG
jgi:hypothetical protein